MNEDSVLRNEQHTVLESQLRKELSHSKCTIDELESCNAELKKKLAIVEVSWVPVGK